MLFSKEVSLEEKLATISAKAAKMDQNSGKAVFKTGPSPKRQLTLEQKELLKAKKMVDARCRWAM